MGELTLICPGLKADAARRDVMRMLARWRAKSKNRILDVCHESV